MHRKGSEGITLCFPVWILWLSPSYLQRECEAWWDHVFLLRPRRVCHRFSPRANLDFNSVHLAVWGWNELLSSWFQSTNSIHINAALLHMVIDAAFVTPETCTRACKDIKCSESPAAGYCLTKSAFQPKKHIKIWMAVVHWAGAVRANKAVEWGAGDTRKDGFSAEVAWEGCRVWAFSQAKSNMAFAIQTPVYADLRAPRRIEQKRWALSQLRDDKLQRWGLCLNSSFGRASRTARCFAPHTFQRAEISQWLFQCLFAMCLNK